MCDRHFGAEELGDDQAGMALRAEHIFVQDPRSSQDEAEMAKVLADLLTAMGEKAKTFG